MPPRPHLLYRLRVLDARGDVFETIDLHAFGVEHARSQVDLMQNEFGIELWDRKQLIERLPPAARKDERIGREPSV